MATRQTADVYVGYNVYVGSERDEVKDDLTFIIEHEKPDVIALQEIAGDVSWLGKWAARMGYVLVVDAKNNSESQSSGFLVARRIPMYRRGFLRNVRKWLGPIRRKVHPGRVFPTIVVGNPKNRATVVHMSTGRKTRANAPAWREQWTRLRNYGRRWMRRSIWLADWNDNWKNRDPWSIYALAKSLGATVYHTDEDVDYALVRGAKYVKIRKGRKLHSDHNYFVVTVIW